MNDLGEGDVEDTVYQMLDRVYSDWPGVRVERVDGAIQVIDNDTKIQIEVYEV